MPWGTRLSDVEMGQEAGPSVAYQALVNFLDRTLKGEGDPPDDRVRYFSAGSGWRWASSWPPPHRVVSFTAESGGNANSRHGDGRLVMGPGESGPAHVLVAEPLVPYPAAPQPLASEAASEDRRDVLCYTSEALTEPLLLAGTPRVGVTTVCDRDTHDVVASLVIVDQHGEPRALSTGIRRIRVQPGEAVRTEITLRPIAWTFPAGSRVRLDLSGARFPTFDRNPHDASVPIAQTPRDGYRVATIEVLDARLGLPVEASR
jgi:hypothetical protein